MKYCIIFHKNTAPDKLDNHQKKSDNQPKTARYARLTTPFACSIEKRLCMAKAFEAGDSPLAILVMEDVMAVLLSLNLMCSAYAFQSAFV